MRPLPVLALVMMLAAASGPARADTRVYRCEDQGRITYSDVACPGARMLAVDGGAAAPDAVERLRRDQAELDARAAARRDALAREAALGRLQRADVAEAPPPGPAADDIVYDFAYGPAGTLRHDARRRDVERGRERERVRRRASVITQPPPTPLRAPR